MNSVKPLYIDMVEKYFRRFMPMSRKDVENFMNYCAFREFRKKEIILDSGETENYLNLVLKGVVRKYIKAGKKDVTLQLATEGHVVNSEISFLTRRPTIVILEALEPVMLCSLSHKNMEAALDRHPLGERFGRLIISGMYIKKDEKRYTQLSKSTRELFLGYVENHPDMLQRVPQKYLASYLNIKPETFSRLKHLIRVKKTDQVQE